MTTVTIQPGPRNAYTDPESGLRYYRWQGRDLPSVTSIRRMAGMPFGLVSWQIRKVVDRATLEHDALTAILTREARPRERVLDKNRREEAARWLRAAATEERDAAADLGTAVHDAAAGGLTPETVPDTVTMTRNGKTVEIEGAAIRPRLGQYLDWLRVSQAEVLLAERQVWTLTQGYAGSFDLLCRWPTGDLYLVDIKTGSGLYSEHFLQLMAYLMAEFVGADDVVDDEATALLQGITGIAILHLADDRWDLVFPRRELMERAWGAFRGLLAFSRFTATYQDPVSWIETKRGGTAVAA